ncbi:hypothetical protein AGDE_14654 [Angomonas deanei]|uniref:Uncharacterized protein n=1 Tax=Angomonas deanei TaxID=59799 RepID=A0A7G2CP55_9TRYP|nr:hypothetical protein AGDE_14654 [Angomonas deanei]CAD2221636.1 hypothetical protein, conserved [Angomonas deanei]|eukprot:EPY20474.1 hypothetical protein AGDE_14654 [Angomonas deanei]
MDDVYKQKVIEERKRHKNGGSKRRQSGDTSMNSNNANENNPERSRTNSAVATSPVVKSGTTKALSEALLSSTSRRGSALPPGPQGRLGSLTGGESAMPSSLGLAAPFTGGGGLPFSSASPTTPVTTMKDKEERTRRRIMEELAAEKRQHTIELERRLTEERSRLENEVKEKRAQTNDAWELYKKKLQSGEAAAEEAARMEATWKTRIAEETAKGQGARNGTAGETKEVSAPAHQVGRRGEENPRGGK